MAAIALTGAGNVTTGFDNGSTDLTINKPSNVVEGSLMIAAVYPRLSSAAYTTPPTGWTLLSQSTNTLTGWNAFYYKVAGASEPSSYTWAGGANGRQTGLIFIVTGADTSDLLDATGGYATKTGNDVVATSISPATSDALLLGFAVMNTTSNDPGTYSPPTGMTTVGDSSTSTGGSDSTSYVAQEQLSASGATGTRTFSGTATATFSSGQSLLTAITSSSATPVPGVAVYVRTDTYAQNQDDYANATYEIDATGSTGTVTLVQQSGTTAAPSESPTGVFTITDPGGTDTLTYLLTAAGVDGGADDTETITISRGAGMTVQPAVRHLVSGGTATTDADWV